MPLPVPAAEPVQITVVESEVCHFCADAHEVLQGFTTMCAATPGGADGTAPGPDEPAGPG